MVEGAPGDDVAGHRVQRVVLEDEHDAARARHPRHLADEGRPAGRGHVVQHADGEHEIERGPGIGHPLPGEMREPRARHGASGLVQRFLARVDAVELAHAGDELGVDEPDAAADVQHLEGLGITQVPPHQREQQPGLVARQLIDIGARHAHGVVDGRRGSPPRVDRSPSGSLGRRPCPSICFFLHQTIS